MGRKAVLTGALTEALRVALQEVEEGAEGGAEGEVAVARGTHPRAAQDHSAQGPH